MNEPVLKLMNNVLNAILLSEKMTLNSSEISTYEKIHHELKNVQNVLGVLWIAILKFNNNNFYKNLYSKNFRIIIKIDTLFGYSWRKNKY